MKSLKELSLRIRNVKCLQKTTKIMQMVSAAKLLQSQKKLLSSKFYISKLHSIISSLLLSVVDDSLLMRVSLDTDNNSHLVFVIGSDRGLCGNFNSLVVNSSLEYVEKLHDKRIDIIFYGKKAFDIGKRKFNHNNILKTESSSRVTIECVRSLVKDISINKYANISILYTKFYNASTQKPTLEIVKPWNKDSSLRNSHFTELVKDRNYEYEPEDLKFIFESLIQSYIRSSIYSALLESIVSENNARIVTMESANRNTNEILNKIVPLYNRSRQAVITSELIEIITSVESS